MWRPRLRSSSPMYFGWLAKDSSSPLTKIEFNHRPHLKRGDEEIDRKAYAVTCRTNSLEHDAGKQNRLS